MLSAETATSSKQHAFDTLAYAKTMESVGFTRQQAEALAQEQAKLIDERLATKADIAIILADVEKSRLATKAELTNGLAVTKAELITALAETKADLIKWVVGLGFAQAGFLYGVLKLHG